MLVEENSRGLEKNLVEGHYHLNYVLPDEFCPVLLRIPKQDEELFDLKVFPEYQLLQLLAKTEILCPHPICNLQHDQGHYQTYISGITFKKLYPLLSRVPEHYVSLIAEEMLKIHSIPTTKINSLIKSVVQVKERFGDITKYNCQNFFTDQIAYISKIWEKYRTLQPGLFDDLYFPKDPFDICKLKISQISNRELCLIHTDLHRANLIIHTVKSIGIIDWELSQYGDPVFDLATHFHLMKYHPSRERMFLDKYFEKSHLNYDDIIYDLSIYRRFCEIKSAIVDCIRNDQRQR